MSRIKSERRNIIGKKSMLFGATVATIVALSVISMVFNSIQTSGWPDSAPLEVHGRVIYQNLTPVVGALVTLTDDTNHEVLTAYTNDTGWYSITFGGPGGPDWTQGGKLIGMANDSMGNQGTNDTLMPPDNQTAGNIVMNFVIDTPITVKNVGDPHHSHPNYGYYPDYGSNEFYYVTLDTPFSFTATDNDGVNATYYRIWYNGSWHPEPGTGIGKGHNFSLYTGTFTLGDFPWAGEGQYYIEFYSDDNNETIQGVEYTHGQWHDVDETKPVYDVWFDDPHSTIHGLDAINCSNAMWVLLYDTGICQSGVEWFNYSVYWNPDEPSGYDWLYDFSIHDNDMNDYDDREGYILARLTFDEECFHEIKWRVTDYVGNYGIYDRDIAVDCTEPVITKEFVGPTVDDYLPSQYGEPIWTPNLWLTNHTVIWLNATDLGCGGGAGVCKLGYWIDWNDDLNGSWDDTKYEPVVVPDNSPLDKDPTVGNISVNLTFKYDCVHEIHYWAVDCVGNNFTHKQKHFVDNTPPVIRKDIEKVNMLEQVYWNDSAIVTYVIDDFQSFLAPWSYIDAVSVYVCGYFDPEYPPVLMIWNETMGDILAYGYPVEIPVDDENYYCGWLQFHLTNRLYTDVGGLYWISVMQNQSTGYIFYWFAYNSYYDGKDKYPDGHAYVNGIENTSWDFTFKIEYYPYHPYIYPFSYTFYNRTISWDGLNGTWVTSKAFFKLTTWDEWCMGGVGVKSLKYRIWWNGTWTPWMNYTQPFNLTEECTHYIEIMAEDLLGNVRIINQTHYVDNSPPDLNVEYPDEHGFYYDNETGKMFVRAGKTFYLNLTDLPECAVGWRDFVFYWRYDYTNFTTPYLEEHPVDENDTEYGTPVFIDGHWWWVQEPGIPSVNLSFDEECRHRIYYFYEASDWLDNSIVTDVEMEEIYVDAYDPVVDKEEPWHHYYEEDTIYLHSDPPINPLDMFMGPPMYTSWHELYPEYGNYYTWTGYTWTDWKETHYYNMTNEEGEEDMYEFINATITLLLTNDTYGEMYVELYGDYMWNMVMFDPNYTLWHEVYPSFSNLYVIVNWTDNGDHVLGYCDYVLMINETDNESIWHVEEVSVDLILKPVPFLRACGRIDMSAKDMPDLLKVVDQAQTDGPLQDTIQVYNPVTTPWPWDAQSFKPNATYINSTKLYLNWSAPATITVYIHNASSWTPGTAIASSTVTLNTSGEGWVEFVFNPGIPVTPNETYYMEVHRSSSSGLVHWYYYAGDSGNDAYKRGNATISGEEENQTERWDWKFQILYWRDNPCASGIEGIYYGYYYNGEWYPRDENDTTEYHTEIVNISIYYNDTVINEDFSGIYLWYVYNDSIGIHFNESCIHDLYYWTKDNVCHHSEIHYKRYRVDKEEPEVDIEFPDHGYAPTYGVGKADIVFVVDTSGSMYDVWDTLDDKMDGLKQQLISQGLDVNVTVYGLASNPSSLNYSYEMTTVWFNGANISANYESWGPGTSWCALWYPWREGATRIVIPISDECAYDGGAHSEDANDAFAVDEAKSLCQNNSVIVFPFYHTQYYTPPLACVPEMWEIANATGGEVNDITELENFSAIFLDIITGAVVRESLRCGAQISLSAVDKPLEETKLIDQIQPVGDYPYPINSQLFITMQSFIPTVDRLDAVSLLLNATYDEVNVSIYDEGFNLLGWNITVVYTWYPAWYQFHFDAINLTPGKTYYIVVTSDYPDHYWWFTNDSYECGHAYMNGEWMPEYDFAFKTEYYGYGEGMCASGIEGIYWRYEYNGTSYPYEMGEGVINLSNYYPDEPDIANYLWYVYNESNGIVFTEECQHDLYYFAKDNVCHHTKIYHRTFFVDNSLPEINKTHPEHGYEVFPEGFLFEEYFDDGLAGWTDTDGAWDTWSSNNAGGIAPEAEGEWPFFKDGSMLISPPIDTSGYREATLSFKTYVDDYSGTTNPYTLHAQISSDGATWQDIWNITPTYDYGPVTVTANLTWMDGIGSSTFYIAFVYTGDPEGIDYWYIDNVTLYGYKAEHLRAGANITLFADDMPEGNCSAGTILKWRFENETGYYPLYYFEGFEDGWLPTDWEAEGCFVWEQSNVNHTGNHSACADDVSGACRLISNNISLPPDINIYLTFWHKAENITNASAANEFDIYIHEDNITIPLRTFSWCYGTLSENWTEVKIDLTPYANKTINLIWTYANGYSPGETWYIDDVEIIGWYEAYAWADVMVNVSFNECWHKLYYFAKDPVCHTTEIHEQEYYVDATPPETTHNVTTYGWRPTGVICIQDEIELIVNNSGRMPCIYPFTDTYYRWKWQDENGTWHYYPDETTPGAINGSTIKVSSHESEIVPYYWLLYTGKFNFTEGCNHTLYYFSKDGLCNTEGVNHWSVGVDDMPPETVMEFQGIHYSPDPEAHYIRNTTIIWLNATDMPNSPFCTTGVNYTLYTIWKYNYSKPGWDVLIPWRSTNDPAPPGIDIFIFNDGTSNRSISIRINLSEIMKPYLLDGTYDTDCGKYEIHWRSVDYNPFYEEEDDRDVIIDCTPPDSTKEFGACNVEDVLYGEIVHWISSSTPIYINATDDEIWDSGVKKVCIRYKRVDKIPFTHECVNGSSGVFYIPPDDGDGKYRIFHWAVDNVEHSEDYNLTKQHVLLDNTPPSSRVADIIPWRREEVPFNITVVDIEDDGPLVMGEYGVGVCKVDVYYRHGITNATLGDWQLYTTYNVPFEDRHDVPNFTFSFDAPDGYGYYRFKSIAYDCVCNEEQPPFEYGTYDAWCYVEYDTQPPNVTKEYGQPCIEWNFGEEIGHAIRSDTPIYINATDNPDENFTGIDKIFWSFDGVTWHHTSSYSGAKEAHYSFLPSDYGLTEGAVYHLFVFATDMLGHTSNDSSEGLIKQKFVIDDSAPSTNIIIEGNDTMPFNVTINANDNLVGTKIIKLYYRYSEDGVTWTSWQEYGSYNGNSHTWQFEYAPYPTYYKPGYYEFYAYAEDYLGNAKSTTPTTEASCYVPPIPGDFNGDGRVNAIDLYNIIVNWGKTPSSPDWSSVQIYDLDNSGKIDAGDIYKLILKWTG